jgi:hypothetical protein
MCTTQRNNAAPTANAPAPHAILLAPEGACGPPAHEPLARHSPRAPLLQWVCAASARASALVLGRHYWGVLWPCGGLTTDPDPVPPTHGKPKGPYNKGSSRAFTDWKMQRRKGDTRRQSHASLPRRGLSWLHACAPHAAAGVHGRAIAPRPAAAQLRNAHRCLLGRSSSGCVPSPGPVKADIRQSPKVGVWVGPRPIQRGGRPRAAAALRHRKRGCRRRHARGGAGGA